MGVVVLLSFSLSFFVSGCSSESLENELAYRQIGINYMNDGEYESAVEAFDNALAEHNGRVTNVELDINYYKALARYESGDVEGGIETCTAIIEYKPKSMDAYYLRGCIYADEGNVSDALSDFETAVSLDKDNYRLYLKIAKSLDDAGAGDEAQKYLEAVVENCNSDESSESARMIGEAYVILEDYDSAEAALSKAADAGDIEAAILLEEICDKVSGDIDTIEYFDAYLEENPEDYDAMLKMGNALMASEKYELAIYYLKSALACEDADNTRQVLKSIVAAYEYSADFDSAFSYAGAYLNAYPDDSEMEREYTFLETRISKNDADEESVDEESTDEP